MDVGLHIYKKTTRKIYTKKSKLREVGEGSKEFHF